MRQRPRIAQTPGISADRIPPEGTLLERDVVEELLRHQLHAVEQRRAEKHAAWQLVELRQAALLVEELELRIAVGVALLTSDVLGRGNANRLSNDRGRGRPGAGFKEFHAVDDKRRPRLPD